MNSKPTLVVLSPRFPYPTEKGDKLRLYHQLHALVQSFNVHLISLSEHEILPEHKAIIDQLVIKNHIIYQSKNRLLKAIFQFILGKGALQVNYYNEKRIKEKVEALISQLAPDILYVQLVRIAHMVHHYKGPKAIDYMDAMSLNMKRESSFRSALKRIVFGLEAQRILKVEQNCSQYFNRKFIISSADKSYLESKGISDLQVISNGVDCAFFDPHKLPSIPIKYDIAFVGNMGYLPNVLAAEYVVHKISSSSKKELSTLIAGARPHRRVQRLQSKNVTVTGWVKDIREAYLSAKVIVAPIFSGAGQQNKILEAMALGKTCITTTQVNQAIRAVKGTEILIADTEEQFLKHLENLWNNPTLCDEIGKNARKFVVENFDWKREGNKLCTELLDLIKERHDFS